MPAPFSVRHALGWTVLATASLWFGLGLVFAAFPGSVQSIVLPGLIQILVYSFVLALFASAQGTPVAPLLALRRAALGACLTAAALGLMLQIPATLLSEAVEHFFPTPAAVLAERALRITPHSAAQGVTIFLIVAGVGPCVEELFFRGALFGALRRGHGALVTALSVALCFAVAHVDLRLFLPLFVTALALGEAREQSGSIWPGVALHCAFNAASLAVVFAGAAPGGAPPPMPVFVAIFGCVASASLLRLLRALTRRGGVSRSVPAPGELPRD